jgi:uncharacterized protein YjiS (DUF1127 family)
MSLSNNDYMISGTQQAREPVGSFLSGWFHHLLANLAQRRARARELQELYRCSDRELWDIGLSRSDFLAIEKGTYSRD